jgi:hypothetical protein
MLTDFFWHVATSNLQLLLIAAVAIAALVVGHVPFGKYAPVIGPYVVLAQFVAYPTLMLMAFLVGVRISDERAETRRLKNELAWSDMQLQQQKATAEDKERLANEKAAEADQLKAKVDDYEKTLATRPVGDCALDAGDLDGLRNLRRRAGVNRRPNPARLRGSGGTSAAPGP